MDKKIENIFNALKKRNIKGIFCKDKKEARELILELIPKTATVGISGSVTLDQLEIVKFLEERGNKVFNQYKPGLTREENLNIRRQGAAADFFLSSTNAITQEGEMVFFSGYGNRIAGISYAKNAIVVTGINKIVKDIKAGIERTRNIATPLNCKRLNWTDTPCFKEGICQEKICLFPEYRRMCCQILIVEAEINPDRLKVILVGENLGF